MKWKKLILILVGVLLLVSLVSSVEYIENSDITFTGTKNKTYWNGTGITLGQDDQQELSVNDGWFSSESLALLYHANNDSSIGENATHFYDSSGNNHNGTSNAGINGNADGKLNLALDTSSANYITTVDNLNNFDFTNNEITWGGWGYNTQANYLGNGYHFSTAISGLESTAVFSSAVISTELFRCLLRDTSGTLAFVDSNAIIGTNAWKHYVCRFNGSQLSMWIDGVKQTDVDNTLASIENEAITDLTIAVDTNTRTAVWQGRLDEVFIYNKSLTDTEMLNLYNSQKDNYFPSPLNGKYATYETFNASAGATYNSISWNVNNNSLTRINITYSLNGGSYTNCGYLSPCNIGSVADNISIIGLYTTDNATFSPELLNLTIDLTEFYVPPTVQNYPSDIAVLTGTLDSGNVTSVQFDNTDYYNVSEVGGSPGFDIRINFTNWTSFDTVYLDYAYDGSAGHTVNLYLKNTTGSDNLIGNIPETSGFVLLNFTGINSTEYNRSGTIEALITHTSPGNINHDLSINFMNLTSSTPVTPVVPPAVTPPFERNPIILPLFITFLTLSVALIYLGLTRPNESACALIGFAFMFMLSFALIDGNLQYKIGENETYVYGNNFTGYHWDYDYSLPGVNNDEFLFHRNTLNVYENYQHRTLGYWLAVVSVIGFAGVLYGLKKGVVKE